MIQGTRFSLFEQLEARCLLSSAPLIETDFGGTTQVANTQATLDAGLSQAAKDTLAANGLTTADNWRFTPFTEILQVAQFDTQGGERELLTAILTIRVDELQDLNATATNNSETENAFFDAIGNADITMTSAFTPLSGDVAIAVPDDAPVGRITVGPGVSMNFVEHDFVTDSDQFTFTLGDAGLADFIGAGNVGPGFDVTTTSFSDINFDGSGNEELMGAIRTIGRGEVSVEYQYLELVDLSGVKFHDVSNFGVRDVGEELLPGWTVRLLGTDCLGNPVDLTTVTDGFGAYSFQNIRPGNYTLSEETQAGWIQTAPTPVPPGTFVLVIDNLVGGDDRTNLDFGNFLVVPDARISITPAAVNIVGQPHTFIALVEYDDGIPNILGGDGVDGFGPAANVNVTITLTPSNGAVPVPAGPFNGPSDGAGEFDATFTSLSGGIVTGNAFATVNGIVVDTDPATVDDAGPGGSGPSIKRFVDAKITIGPPFAVNDVNDPHVFTSIVWVDDGNGTDLDGEMGNYDRWTGAPVSISLANSLGAVANPAGPFAGNTNASGEFATAPFTSATPGTVTGTASTTVTLNTPQGIINIARTTDGSQTVIGSGVFNSGPAIKEFRKVGGEGLTPGFWKNNASKKGASAWTAPYTPSTKLNTIGFVLPGTLGNLTMLKALELGGGGINALIRHAVAAVLNAAHPEIDYGIATPAEVIAQVNAAVASGTSAINALKDLLEGFNEQGGGVDQHNNPI